MPINKDDFLQPDNPRFKQIYGYNPFEQAKEQKRIIENQKQDREDRIKYNAKKGLVPYGTNTARDIIKYAREHNLEK